MDMRDDGEPISRGQLDRRAADKEALRDLLLFLALFLGAVLVNGILWILLIELLQALDWWDSSATESASSAAGGLSDRMRARSLVD
jgi:hypothetical protein